MELARKIAPHGAEIRLPDYDLSGVVARMKKIPDYAKWSEKQFEIATLEYRRYVALCKEHPFESLIPGRQVDAVWHQHILLDTEQYMKDCQDYLGRYLHHRTHSRIDGPKPSDGWTKTLRYYEQAFGTVPDQSWLKGQAECNCND